MTSAIDVGGAASLGRWAQGRDNNLNLIRVIAATAVLLSHSYVICSGDAHAEPWVTTLGMAPGGVAVDAFFALSGFLVAGSLCRSRSVTDFVWARVLRIYPALWVALLLSTLVIGLGFTALDRVDFWADPQTWRYLGRNAVMVTGGDAILPGAFDANPFRGQVNASLWTLRWELRLYLVMALLGWWFGRRAKGTSRIGPLVFVAAAGFVALTLMLSAAHRPNDSARLAAMFFSGTAFWFYRDRVRLDMRWAFAATVLMAGGAFVSPLAFETVYRLVWPYVLFCLAYLPAGPLRSYNRVGDYSYGIYVYACPVQQMVVALVPGVSAWALSGIALPISIVLAAVSWHLLEQPALRLKHRAAGSRRLPGPPLRS